MEKVIVFSNKEKTLIEIKKSTSYENIILDLGDLDIDPPFLNYILKIFRLLKSNKQKVVFISKKGLNNEMNKYFRFFQSLDEYRKMKIFTNFTIKIYLSNTYLRDLLRDTFVSNGFLTKEREELKFLNKEHDSKDRDIYIINFEKYQSEKLNEIKKIKEKNSNCKIVLLIDKQMAYRALRTVKLGVDSIIEKPVNIEEILATVKNLAMQSRLQKENEELNRKIEKELALASDIQKNLLPEKNIEFNGYRVEYLFQPSQKIGGDFCDVLKLDENRLAIIFADISGHGIPAALLSTMLKSLVVTEIKKYMKTNELLENLNERIINIFPDGKFVSLFYLIIDSAKNTFTYCKGSQEPALLLRNNKVEKLETEGQVLGIFSKKNFPDLVNFEEKSMEFKKDDVILLYTDGITEAHNENGYYGDEHLEKVFLKEKQDIYKIKESLNEYILEDDLTLLTIWRYDENI